MQTSAMKACFQIAECSFSSAKKYEIFLFSASFWGISFVFSKEKCKFAEKNKIAYGKVYKSIF